MGGHPVPHGPVRPGRYPAHAPGDPRRGTRERRRRVGGPGASRRSHPASRARGRPGGPTTNLTDLAATGTTDSAVVAAANGVQGRSMLQKAQDNQPAERRGTGRPTPARRPQGPASGHRENARRVAGDRARAPRTRAQQPAMNHQPASSPSEFATPPGVRPATGWTRAPPRRRGPQRAASMR
jgi:hypothetical protein